MAENQPKPTKKERERSTPYPGLSLSDAIDATERLRTAYGATSAYSRETVAEALGYRGLSGAATKKVAALSHFGLLERDGSVYRQSDIANRIFNNLTDDEKRDAIVEAFKRPALYQKLINEFDAKALPTSLDKVLIRNHNVTESAAKSAAKIFVESAIFAGVLQHGVLDTSFADSAQVVDQDEDETNPQRQQGGADQKSKVPGMAVGSDLTVEVPGTGIVVGFPAKYAYDLSIGAFAESIKQLKKDAEVLAPVEDETLIAHSED